MHFGRHAPSATQRFSWASLAAWFLGKAIVGVFPTRDELRNKQCGKGGQVLSLLQRFFCEILSMDIQQRRSKQGDTWFCRFGWENSLYPWVQGDVVALSSQHCDSLIRFQWSIRSFDISDEASKWRQERSWASPMTCLTMAQKVKGITNFAPSVEGFSR